MNIVTDPQQLKQKTDQYCVPDKDRLTDVIYMKITLEKEMNVHHGQGIAANQIGVNKSVFIMKCEQRSPICLVNPVIIKSKGSVKTEEGCLSIPGKRYLVKRPRQVVVKGFNQFMVPVTFKFCGIEARRACHEIDHLNGILISVIGTEVKND
jgi:peptide deformylase